TLGYSSQAPVCRAQSVGDIDTGSGTCRDRKSHPASSECCSLFCGYFAAPDDPEVLSAQSDEDRGIEVPRLEDDRLRVAGAERSRLHLVSASVAGSREVEIGAVVRFKDAAVGACSDGFTHVAHGVAGANDAAFYERGKRGLVLCEQLARC